MFHISRWCTSIHVLLITASLSVGAWASPPQIDTNAEQFATASTPDKLALLGGLIARRVSAAPASLDLILRTALSDADGAVREGGLATIVGRTTAPLLTSDAAVLADWQRERATLVALRPLVVQALTDTVPSVRMQAIAALTSLDYEFKPPDPAPEALPAAAAGVTTGELPAGAPPATAITSLTVKKLMQPATADALTAHFRTEPQASIRAALLSRLLFDDTTASAVAALLAAGMADPEADVRYQAVLKAGGMAPATAVPALVKRLQEDENAEVRLLSASTLRHFSTDASPYLTALDAAFEKEPDLRVKAQLSLALDAIRTVKHLDPQP